METQLKTNTLSWAENVLQDSKQLRRSAFFDQGDESWFGATVDSRADCHRRLFFALRGENTDGHRFVTDAVTKGCSAVVIEDEPVADKLLSDETPFFLVKDAVVSLQEIARSYRDMLDIRVVAVTGSAGKTTTKEYIRSILKKKYRVHSNTGNLNNHIGVPLTILETSPDNEYLVAEVGANHIGEVGLLASMLRADVAVITNIGDAHIGLFGSREKIAEAKAELLDPVEAGGVAVLPGDDQYLDALRKHTICKVVTFGYGQKCTFRISDVQQEEDSVRFHLNGEQIEIRSFGDTNVLNAAAAAAVGDLCGVEVARIARALEQMQPVAGRGTIHHGDGWIIIDDSYNANPTSMKAALDALVRFPGARKIAVLGDMGELGSYSEAAHQDVGTHINELGVADVFWVGKNAALVNDVCSVVQGFESADDVVDAVRSMLRGGDVVLVKASRAMQLDRVVGELTGSGETERNH